MRYMPLMLAALIVGAGQILSMGLVGAGQAFWERLLGEEVDDGEICVSN